MELTNCRRKKHIRNAFVYYFVSCMHLLISGYRSVKGEVNIF